MPDMQLSDEILIYWTNFAKLSNPNGDLDTSEPGMFEIHFQKENPTIFRMHKPMYYSLASCLLQHFV
jgi:hypothetical protein